MWRIEILTGKSDIIGTLRDEMTVLRRGQVHCVDAKEMEMMTLCGFWLLDNITKFRSEDVVTKALWRETTYMLCLLCIMGVDIEVIRAPGSSYEEPTYVAVPGRQWPPVSFILRPTPKSSPTLRHLRNTPPK